MKRGTFLKSLIIAVTAPSVLTSATPKQDVVPPSKISTASASPNLNTDHLRIYVDRSAKVRVGDLIRSDLGDIAYVCAVAMLPEYTVVDAMPVICRTYHYEKLEDFNIIVRSHREHSNEL